MIVRFNNIRTVIASIYRTLGTNSEVPEADIMEWAAESLAIIGAYSQYTEVSVCLDLKNGKAKLPCGFDKLVDISYLGKPLYWASNTNANNYQCTECSIPTCNDPGGCDTTFYLNDSYLITNIKESTSGDNNSVCIVYLGIPVDEDGYPMIPDDVYYTKAVSSYIIERVDYQEWRKGKITDKVYEKSEFNWLFYVNSARAAGNMPNAAQLQNLSVIMTRLMPLRHEYSKGFKNITSPERLNLKP